MTSQKSYFKKKIFAKALKIEFLLILGILVYYSYVLYSEKKALDNVYSYYLKHQIGYKISKNTAPNYVDHPYIKYNNPTSSPFIVTHYFYDNEIVTEQRNVGEFTFLDYQDYYSPREIYNVLENYHRAINKNNLELPWDFLKAKALVLIINKETGNEYYSFKNKKKAEYSKELFDANPAEINVEKITSRCFKVVDWKILVNDILLNIIILSLVPIIFYIIRLKYSFNIKRVS